MICPACREEMIVVEYKQIELDVCVFCKGVWFDADELALLLESLELSAGDLARPLSAKTAEKPRRCPRCRRKMEKVLMGPGDGVMIDRCRKEHGLWFDGGELDAVIKGLSESAAGGEAAPGAGISTQAGGEVGSFLADVLLAGDEDKEKGGEE